MKKWITGLFLSLCSIFVLTASYYCLKSIPLFGFAADLSSVFSIFQKLGWLHHVTRWTIRPYPPGQCWPSLTGLVYEPSLAGPYRTPSNLTWSMPWRWVLTARSLYVTQANMRHWVDVGLMLVPVSGQRFKFAGPAFVERPVCIYRPRHANVPARILVQVTIHRRLLIGRDGRLDQSEAYDVS